MKQYIFPGLLLLAFLAPAAALAQNQGGTNNTLPGGTNNTAPGGTSVTTGQSYYNVNNPLGANNNSFCGLVKKLLQAALQVGIPIAVLFIVYAGFKFVLARGKPEALAEARKNLMWTLIGIAIFLGAWLIADVVANTINALGAQPNIISCN